jgi:hypothetical protein
MGHTQPHMRSLEQTEASEGKSNGEVCYYGWALRARLFDDGDDSETTFLESLRSLAEIILPNL